MNKKGLSILFLITLMMVQTSLAVVHIDPKVIKKPDDLSYKVGTTGNTLIWQYEASESLDFPGTYTVFKDNVVLGDHNGTAWADNVDIVVNVDGLALGSYTFKIEVTDHDSSDDPLLTSTDEAIVTVVTELADTSSPESSTESDTSLLFIPVLAMLLAIGIGVPILKYRDFKH